MQYTCQSCSQRFSQDDLLPHYLSEHMPSTTKPRQAEFRCPLQDCGRTFAAKHYMRMHLERGHMMRPEDAALILGEQAPPSQKFDREEYSLQLSLQEDPCLPADQKAQCPVCGAGFLTHKHLQRHIEAQHPTPSQIINTGSSETWCGECSKSFSSKYNLDRHQELHRNTPGVNI